MFVCLFRSVTYNKVVQDDGDAVEIELDEIAKEEQIE